MIIPTRNGMPLIRCCLEAVLAQDTDWPFELIVIDSASSDGMWELLESLPIVRTRIQPNDFNHGRTRNLGANMARGQSLVFLVQDAIPVDRLWLRRLVEAAELAGVAGSYGRQIARPDSNLLTRRRMERSQPAALECVVKRLPHAAAATQMSPAEQLELTTFTDVCACLRREVWSLYPYAEIAYGEDMEWAQRVLKAGYAIAYEPSAAVYHSHDRSAWYEFKRAYADHHLVQRLFGLRLIPSPWRALRTVAWGIKDAWQYVLAGTAKPMTKARLMLWAPLLISAQVGGQYLGARAEQLRVRFNWYQRLDAALRYGI